MNLNDGIIRLSYPKFEIPDPQCNPTAESAELFVNCLEAMVETCLPVEEGEGMTNSEQSTRDDGVGVTDVQYPSMLAVNYVSNINLSATSSGSLNMASPTEKEGNVLGTTSLDRYQ